MLTQEQIPTLMQSTAYDPSGDKIGSIKQVYLDDRTDRPQFATVHTGLFGLKESFVPLDGAELHGDRVVVPVDKAQVKDAPSIDPEGSAGSLTPTQVAELHRHYHLPARPGGTRDAYAADVDSGSGEHGHGQHYESDQGNVRFSGRETRTDRDDTRDERLATGSERHEPGPAGLRRYVATDER
ncbi:PRC-barrel domain-containing protein [Cryptosporangium arvum]|uniref:PRC-barrel domain-containing protein n=1 Tax=Cryptosporangium arvum DSM 44712 TaxID=927661 RepID=A0A010YLI6_9ACTN|nr:PRC-barrel domain-containing protein [Cryptosporangium arvum]EXG81090.1 PRC-barrel domain-containing protein [Cryptosporangium arvum DSM 44712]